jgi:acid phosphatase (class A)
MKISETKGLAFKPWIGLGLSLILILALGLALDLTIESNLWQTPVQAAQPEGFLDPSVVPNSLNFLTPPPADDSPDFARDINVYWKTRVKPDDARWAKATADADLQKNWTKIFLDSFGLEVDKKTAPVTNELITRAITDLDVSVSSTKKNYSRIRPFAYFNQPFGTTCFPSEEASLKNNGSYPSGHSAYGWLMALILAEISPERQDAILARGLDFGYARVICGVHWISDVEAARYVSSAVFARLHDSPEFLEQLAKAKEEIAQVRAAAN